MARGRTSEKGDRSDAPRHQPGTQSIPRCLRDMLGRAPRRLCLRRPVLTTTSHRIAPPRSHALLDPSACRLPLRHRHQRHRATAPRADRKCPVCSRVAPSQTGRRRRRRGDPERHLGGSVRRGQRHFGGGPTTLRRGGNDRAPLRTRDGHRCSRVARQALGLATLGGVAGPAATHW